MRTVLPAVLLTLATASACTVFSFNVNAQESRWTLLARSADGRGGIFVDKSRLRWRGSSFIGWIKGVDRFSISLEEYEGDCNDMSVRRLQSAIYDTNGAQLATSDRPTSRRTVLPDTVEEQALLNLCANFHQLKTK